MEERYLLLIEFRTLWTIGSKGIYDLAPALEEFLVDFKNFVELETLD